MSNKKISVEEIEQNPDKLDEVMHDCHTNNTVYDIYQDGELKCKMIPYEEYEEMQRMMNSSD